jgi:Flp pilus assembly protein TadG
MKLQGRRRRVADAALLIRGRRVLAFGPDGLNANATRHMFQRHRLLTRFLSQTKGSAAIEFGALAGIVLLLIVEAMQAGFFLYTSASLDQATNRAARQILTGAVANQGLTAALFRTQVLCPLLPAGMACSSIITNIRAVSEDLYPNGFYNFVKSDQSGIIPPIMDNTQTSYCPGSAGSYVYIQVYYAMPLFSPTWRTLAATTWNGAVVSLVSAAAAFKSEPYQSATQAGSC